MEGDLHDSLPRLGFRIAKEALDALLIHAQKLKLSPTALLEERPYPGARP